MMKQAVYYYLQVLLAAAIFTKCQGVRVQSCSKNPADDIIKVNWFNTNPDPIRVPGDLFISASVSVLQPIAGRLVADVTISRNIALMWIDLPCLQTSLGHLGSCTFRDVCSSLARVNGSCPRVLVDNNIPCACPIPAGTYTIPRTSIPLNLNNVLGFSLPAVSGEYQASIRLTDTSTMRQLACYDIDVEITDASKPSTFGSIGRFFVNLFG